jgi:hypothetical protein
MHPASIAGRQAGVETIKARAVTRRAAKVAAAREWRARNKPFFDALYGPESQCEACGQPLQGAAQ